MDRAPCITERPIAFLIVDTLNSVVQVLQEIEANRCVTIEFDVRSLRGHESAGADAHIDALTKKYMGLESYPNRQPGEQRVIYKIEPQRFSTMG